MSELRRIRIGTDITMSVSLSDSDIRMSWDGVNVKHVVLYSDDQKVQAGRGEYSVSPDTPELMKVVYGAGQQCYLGAYRLVVQFSVPVEGGEDRTYTADVPAFELVATTDEVRNIPGESGDDDVVGLHLNLESIDSSLVQELISACINATEDALQTAAEVKETDETVKGNEKDRVEAEEVRVSNEQQRILNEEARARAEQLRAEAENGRSEAEKERVSAEEGRKSAEEGRVKAESAREEAELKRQTDTAAAIEAANKAAEAANDAASNVDADQIVPRLRQLEEEVPNKVDKVEGKGLSTNDYTDEEKRKLDGKQDALVSGENIKTINGVSLLGPGNMTLDLSLYKVVESLPETGIDPNKIYLVLDTSGEEGNEYTEYVYVIDSWEELGTYKATVDLTPYLKTEDAAQTYLTKAEASSTYATKTELGGKVDKVEGKGLSTNDYTDTDKEKLGSLEPFPIGSLGLLSASSSQQEIETALGCTCDELAAAVLAGRPILATDGTAYSPVVMAGGTDDSIIMRLKEPNLLGFAGLEVYCILGKSGDAWSFATFSTPQMLSSEDIADNLTTSQYSGNYVLSAYQGKVLKGMIDSLEASMDSQLGDVQGVLEKINNETL